MFEAIVRNPNPDPTHPGHILVEVPELYGPGVEMPSLVPPLMPGWGGGGWQSIPGSSLDGKSARVIVVYITSGTLRWIGHSQVWSLIGDAAPGTRCGARSGSGGSYLYLDDSEGVVIRTGATTGITIADGTATIFGGKIYLGDGRIPPTHPFILSTTFMTDLAAVLTEVVAAMALIPYTAVNTPLVLGKVQTSLADGLPYLSTRITGN